MSKREKPKPKKRRGPSAERSDRTFSERALRVLCTPCPECLAGWGLACRTIGDGGAHGLRIFHSSRLAAATGKSPSPRAYVSAPSGADWMMLLAASYDKEAERQRYIEEQVRANEKARQEE